MAQTIPSSDRSKKAISNVTNQLVEDFESKNLIYGNPVYLRIFKQEAQLEIWVKNNQRFELFRSYPICTYGFAGLGPKIKQGDGKAPEGFYFVKPQQLNPYSSYHLSFNLGYPNKYDRSYNRTGSALMVHGNCVSVGCYAMTDAKIEEIYAIVNAAFEAGQDYFRVHAFPFRMTQANMLKYKGSEWIDFWKNLKQGYDLFESKNYNPPNVEVKNKKYVFD